MNARLCPNCSALIESESAFFCYNCGAELNREVEVKEDKVAEKREEISLAKTPSRAWVLPVFLTVCLLLSFLAIFGLPSLTERKMSRKAFSPVDVLPTPPANELTATVSALPLAPFDLTAVDFAGLVPSTADFLIQSRSPALFLKSILNEEQKEKFSQVTGLTLSEALSFLNDDYAFARLPEGFLFLTSVKDAEFVKTKIAELPKNVLRAEVKDAILFVSDSAKVLSQAESVGKTVLSLSQVSDFFENRRRLPKLGQAIVYAKDRTLVPEAFALIFGDLLAGDLDKLAGNAFVIDSKEGSARIVGVNGKD